MKTIEFTNARFFVVGLLWVLVASLLHTPLVHAGTEWTQATITKELSKECKKGMPRSAKDYQAALTEVKIAAIRTWGSQKSVAEAKLLSSAESEIHAALDTYLLNPLIRSDCNGKTFKLAFKAEINVAALEQLMARNAPAVVGPKSRMTAVFIARKQMSVKIYADKVTQIDQQTSISEAEQSADVSGESMSAVGTSQTTEKSVTGGSVEKKANKVRYSVFNSGALDAAVTENFSSSGFTFIDASQVGARFPGFDLNAFRDEFGVGDDLSPETKNAAFDAIRGKIPLLVVATVDVLKSAIDPFSGNNVVVASVKAWVYRDDGLFFESVAAVAPTQMRGEGTSDTAAETNALVKAAEAASKEIVNQLKSAGIQ